jgi:hypothetical protein
LRILKLKYWRINSGILALHTKHPLLFFAIRNYRFVNKYILQKQVRVSLIIDMASYYSWKTEEFHSDSQIVNEHVEVNIIHVLMQFTHVWCLNVGQTGIQVCHFTVRTYQMFISFSLSVSDFSFHIPENKTRLSRPYISGLGLFSHIAVTQVTFRDKFLEHPTHSNLEITYTHGYTIILKQRASTSMQCAFCQVLSPKYIAVVAYEYFYLHPGRRSF